MNNPLYSTNFDENKYKTYSSVNMNNSKISEISSSKSPLRSNTNKFKLKTFKFYYFLYSSE